jgi:hypothetical protein
MRSLGASNSRLSGARNSVWASSYPGAACSGKAVSESTRNTSAEALVPSLSTSTTVRALSSLFGAIMSGEWIV